MATPALDDLAAIWADICLLGDRHGSKLLDGKVSGLPDLLLSGREASESDDHGAVGYVPMAITGYLEQVQHSAQRTRIPGMEFPASGKDEVVTTVFLAMEQGRTAGALRGSRDVDAWRCSAWQALYVTGRQPPPARRPFVGSIRNVMPPVEEDRLLAQNTEGRPSGSRSVRSTIDATAGATKDRLDRRVFRSAARISTDRKLRLTPLVKFRPPLRCFPQLEDDGNSPYF